MKFISTRKNSETATFHDALFRGLAEDGGLYVPENLPLMSSAFVKSLPSLSLQEISFEIAGRFIAEIPSYDLRHIVDQSINFDAPLCELAPGLFALELFHGPTLAFKDFGARFMARVMSYFREANSRMLNILVATSGDTGGAVASGFYNLPGIRVILLYPSGQVSPVQEKQLSTWDGNVIALEVQGNFDDCQKLVKQAFADFDVTNQLDLTSANSINVGRLIPQCFYYWYAFSRLGADDALFSVPSGNYGNLTAGLWSKKMGLPAGHFIAACNRNSPVPQFLETGELQVRPTVRTLSNSMDVGNPSNFERIQNLYDGDIVRMRSDFSAYNFSEDETRAAITEIFDQYGYISEPHGAIAYLGWKATNTYIKNAVLLQTAHPAKFPDALPPAVILPVPSELSLQAQKPKKTIVIKADFQEFKSFLMSST